MDVSRDTAIFLSRPHSCADLPDGAIASLRDSSSSNAHFLDTLAQLSLDPRYCARIVCGFEALVPEICARWPKHANLAALIAAYGRIISSAPYMSEAFAQILDGLNVAGDLVSVTHEASLQDQTSVLLGLLRLLRADDATFSKLIRPASLQLLLGHQHLSIRYLAARLLCLFLHASDASFQQILLRYCGSEALTGPYEDIEIDYAFLDLWEQHRRDRDFALCESQKSLKRASPPDSQMTRILQQDDLSSGVVNIGGILMPCGISEPVVDHADTALVHTPTTINNMEALARALQSPDPILIQGASGSGKTLTINHVASCLGKASTMVTLHLNEQSDAKALLGIYTTGDEPGSFHWKPGVLTTAVLEGRWVLIEDVDRAPTEVLSVLIPLLERRQLRIPGHDTCVNAKAGFKTIATMRVRADLHGRPSQRTRPMLGAQSWRNVSFDLLAEHEIRHVVMQQFPILSKLMDNVLEVYRKLQTASQESRRGERERAITSRDLVKWCSRIATNLQESQYQPGKSSISNQTLDEIFLDAVDCFLGTRPEHDESRAILVSQIATALGIDPSRRDYLSQTRVPPVKTYAKKVGVTLCAGRSSITLPNLPRRASTKTVTAPFSMNRHSCRLMEAVGAALTGKEPLLLVGETGIGKTSAVQHMASLMNQPLLAINLSQQSEVSDLIGGYKPVSVRSFVIPLKDEFDDLWEQTFSESTQKNNEAFTKTLSKTISKSKWKNTVVCFKEAVKLVDKKLSLWSYYDVDSHEQPSKRRKISDGKRTSLRDRWLSFSNRLEALESRVQKSSGVFAFSFVEGKLVNAVREGSWVLLDEINLASPDTLECLSDLLEAGPQARPSILLSETGSTERIEAHPNFRLIAAMNPSTDIGKRDLPPGIRSRFTEVYVESLDRDRSDLEHLIQTYICQSTPTVKERQICSRLASLYSEILTLAQQGRLLDGSSQKPQYSLRTLTRSLQHAVTVISGTNLKRALYEGFSMCFSTCLGTESFGLLDNLIVDRIFEDQKFATAELRKSLEPPKDDRDRISFEIKVRSSVTGSKPKVEKYWLPRGNDDVLEPADYIVTPYIGRNLKNLIRAASTRKYPVLIQGPTSAGKTSMVEYLAQRSGNRFVRINNHEHTDLQEYLGTYVSNSEGRILFQEGVLVDALKNGFWVVLDELNLAPTDILEALNRLLDDNRELFIPETQETVKPHPNFMLFATQNPVGAYGGRKILSRAFRNRFLELHFDDIPVAELNVILAARSELPESWCAQIIEVYKKLSQRRHEQRLFEQSALATLRDLFRWAFRGGDTMEELARNGALLLVDKVRDPEERNFVRETIEDVMSRKGVKLDLSTSSLYLEPAQSLPGAPSSVVESIVWTHAMCRLASLVTAAVKHNEPVLLVGETGGGKTTICQILAQASQKKLYAVNAHQNMETGDLIGAQRPVRNRVNLEAQLIALLRSVFKSMSQEYCGDEKASAMVSAFEKTAMSLRSTVPKHVQDELQRLQGESRALFKWHDGALVQSMREGNYFLLDEISLADDSVLERMNSVLDPQRSVLLAEKGALDSFVTAAPGFKFFATMNPGGDFGKKELSPALRNRFTEIWVPPVNDKREVYDIVREKIRPEAKAFGPAIVEFATWFGARYRSSRGSSISIRDILSWINFINLSKPTCRVEKLDSVVHGAMLVYIDTLGANPAGTSALSGLDHLNERKLCLSKLGEHLDVDTRKYLDPDCEITRTQRIFYVGPFGVDITRDLNPKSDFQFEIQTARVNAMRVLRGLQVDKPILIEGAPGVGKTSLVTALASSSGQGLTRINLSDQTDLMDLFGSDVPVDDAESGTFAWRDAPFLKAMKTGGWVLLDEMNLASQPILEGLNACIDHRGEVYVPELDKTFNRHPDFRLFAAQNPQHQGGGRKGLPLSFVNRFTVVFADTLSTGDLRQICTQTFPGLDTSTVENLVAFIADLERQLRGRRGFGANGSPWEFNLRDALRTLFLLQPHRKVLQLVSSAETQDVLEVVFAHRFRSISDQRVVRELITSHFGPKKYPRSHHCNLTPSTLQIGLGLIRRRTTSTRPVPLSIMVERDHLFLYESITIAIQVNWPILLIGGARSKTTEMIKNLAVASSSVLDVLSISSDVDASDLIGSFEQVDPLRPVRSLLSQIASISKRALLQLVEAGDQVSRQIYDLLFKLSTCNQRPGDDTLKFTWVRATLRDLVAYMDQETGLAQLRDIFASLQGQFSKAAQSTIRQSAAKFQWIDSALVKAIEEGHWLVLENANLCSASVLDRLNSLLEPNSVLIVNEHGDEDGTAREIVPHPEFRIFLTVDPQYGEISRAMRNRALELFVPNIEGGSSQIEINLDSSIFRFHQSLTAGFAAVQERSQGAAALQAFQILSRHDLSKLDRFSTQARHGLLNSVSNVALARVMRNYAAMAKLGCSSLQSILEEYRKLSASSSADFKLETFQPTHPLNNQPFVLALGTKNFQETVLPLALLHDVQQESASLQVSWEDSDIDTHISTQKVSSSATSRFALALKDALSKLGQEVINSIKDFSLDVSAPKVALQTAQQLIWYWLALFRAICRAKRLDDFLLESCVLSVKRRIESYAAGHNPVTALVTSFSRTLENVTLTRTPTTGLSIERIWTAVGSQKVYSRELLNEFLSLEQTARTIDDLSRSFRVPVATLSAVRLNFIDLGVSSLDDRVPIMPLLSDLRTAIEEIRSRARQNDLGSLFPHFGGVFTALYQTSCLSRTSKQRHYGQGIPQQILEILSSMKSEVDLRVLLWNHNMEFATALYRYFFASAMGPLDLITAQDIPFRALHAASTIGDVRLDSYDLLQAELECLGQIIGRAEASSTKKQLTDVTELIIQPLYLVLHAHEDLLEFSILARLNSLREHFNPSEFASILKAMLSQATEEHSALKSSSHRNFFDNIVTSRLVPGLQSLTSGIENASWSDFGQGMTAIAISFLQFFVPDQMVDPVQRAQVDGEVYGSVLEEVNVRKDVISRMEKTLTGQASNLKIQLLDEALASLGLPPARLEHSRPDLSRLPDLHVDFNSLLRVIDRAKISVDAQGVSRESLKAISNDADRIIERLSTNYREYDDLVAPAVGFLLLLKMGCLIQARFAEAENAGPAPLKVPFLGCRLSQWHDGSGKRLGDGTSQRHIMNSLSQLRTRSSLEHPLNWPVTAQDDFCALIESSFRLWKRNLSLEQKAAASASSLYHYRGGQEDLDDEEQQAFEEIFPNYDATSEEETQESLPVRGPKFDSRAFPVEISALHSSILLRNVGGDGTDVFSALLSEAGRAFACQAETGLSEETSLLLAAPLLLALEKHRISPGDNNQSRQPLNIYTDCVLDESLKLRDLTAQTHSRASDILQTWPEHATLHNIRQVCTDIFAFKHTEPLIKLLTKTEQLHAQVAEWQTVASREFSMGQEYNSLTSMIVSWRRLELSTWARLLDIEEQKARQQAGSWFFVAYESLVSLPLEMTIKANEADSHVLEIVKTVEGLVRASSLGQFQMRLDILAALQTHLKLLKSKSLVVDKLAGALSNLVSYFKRYSQTVQTKIDQSRRALEKQVKDVVQLASWRDVNITSLRQSAKASHRKLFSVIKKYRELLSQSASDMLADLPPTEHIAWSTQAMSVQHAVFAVDPLAQRCCEEQAELWQERPLRFKNITATTAVMSKMVGDYDLTLAEQLVEFGTTVEDSAKRLRDATPNVLSEDNTASVKHLQTRKRRLYADTLKSLKDMGFKHTQTPAILFSQRSLAAVLARSELFWTQASPDGLSSYLKAQEENDYFSASLHAMDTARSKASSHSEEITHNDITRSIGLCEGMLSLTLGQRQMLRQSCDAFESFSETADEAMCLWSGDASAVQRSPTQAELTVGDCLTILRWLPSIISTGQRILHTQSRLAQLDFTEVTTSLQRFVEQFEKFRRQLYEQPSVPEGLVLKSSLKTTETIRSTLTDFENTIQRLSKMYPPCETTLRQMLLWTAIDSPAVVVDPAVQHDWSIQKFNKRLYALLDQILKAIEDVKQAKTLIPVSTEAEAWLMGTSTAYEDVLRAFKIRDVHKSFSQLSTLLTRVGREHASDFDVACASIKLAAPIVQQYRALYADGISSFFVLHRAVSKTHYKLTMIFNVVASQGFCKPADKADDQDSGKEKVESGTGLGEGEAAEDISKDIAGDEDLSELAQDAQNAGDGKHEGRENQDDAVDIEDEMVGGANGEKREEDESDEGESKEKDEDGNGEDKEAGDGAGEDDEGVQEEGAGDEGMDEGVGEVDDLEPSAVDEKFWDQAGEDDKREKEGKQSASNKDQSEQAAGKDESKQREHDVEAENDVEGEQASDDSQSDGEGDEPSTADDARPDQKDIMDPHVHESEDLDLPEDLNLDGDKNVDPDETGDDDLDMDMLSNEGSPDLESKSGDADSDEDSGIEEDDGNGKTVPEQDMDVDAEEDEAWNEEDPSGQDNSEKPYANEEQGNQDVDPTGTAQGTDGTEMMAGTGQAAGQEVDQPERDEDMGQEPDENGAEREAEAQPAGSGDQGRSAASKPPQGQTRRNAEEESIKKLGDILERWHQQHRRINESTVPRDEGHTEQQDLDLKDADFEHLPDEEAQADTQALGAADREQARALDDNMALPNDKNQETAEQQEDRFLPDMAEQESDAEDADVDMEDANEAADNDNVDERTKSMVGERSDRKTDEDDKQQPAADDASNESISDVNDDFETMQLETQPESPARDTQDPHALWAHHEWLTTPLSLILTEQLRLILTPTQATKLRGDFRTGKRLNLKRIIPYIASSYKRDKIWLRRSAPSKRTYQIQLAIDDSRSMRDNGAADLALSCLALVARSLTMLEAGELGVLGFGADVFVAHALGAPFVGDAGAAAVRRFAFAQTGTDVRRLVARSVAIFREARLRNAGAAADTWQLQIVVSDGICEDHGEIRRLLLEAAEERIMFVFIVVDAAAKETAAAAPSQSILDLERVEFVEGARGEDGAAGEMRLVRKRYLDTFPFRYFLVCRDVRHLPDVLAGALRSWFAEVAQT